MDHFTILGYTADADTWCAPCIIEVYGSTEGTDGEGNDIHPIFLSGSESDTPTHCNRCGVFLENDLTPNGYAYVAEAVEQMLVGATGAGSVVTEWVEFYTGQTFSQGELTQALLATDYGQKFLHATVRAGLWADLMEGEGGEHSDNGADYSLDDFTDYDRQNLEGECAGFLLGNLADLAGMDPEQAGHDFWLTRNHHGAGFWDRGLGERGDRLTANAHPYGSISLFLDEHGFVSVM